MTPINPDDVRLVTSDIGNFWRAYDLSEGKTTEEKIEIYNTEYLAIGSIGLLDFTEAHIQDAEKLVNAIEAMPKYYASIRVSSNRVLEMTDRIRDYMHAWKDLYAEAVFPDVYFVIGRMMSAGTFSSNGLLIGTEILSRSDDVPEEELRPVYLKLVKPIEYLPYVVIHELIHPQQKYDFDGTTLLGHSIMEGAADFLGELASGGLLNQLQHEYGRVHEMALWDDFSREMLKDNMKNWLYNYFEDLGDRPPDMGYYMGYRICESYYEKMDDKRQAIRDILAVKDATDALRFLQESGYGQ